jgi:hypothetical protein
VRLWASAVLGFAIVAAACASGGTDSPLDAMGGPDDGGSIASSCPDGEFATAVGIDGQLLCAPIDAAALAAITNHCSLYFGWRDSCDGCTTAPEKWGQVSGVDCANGVGVSNTCALTDLGGVELPLFGLNTDGSVNDDDKFYAGLRCAPPADEPVAGPCPEGSYLGGILGESVSCVTGQAAIAEYLAGGCQIYFGWRDNCDGCTSAPLKWGRASTSECSVETGLDSSCTSLVLGEDSVFTLGINTDGDVNGDDKFYLGFQCTGAGASDSTSFDSCPEGELVVGIDELGRVRCTSPVVAAEAVVQDDCYLYFGWRDGCDGCTTAPSKWGRVGHTSCENGTGLDNTCASTPLDGTSVQLFGLNTDGDVDGNDKFYLGLACPGGM